MTFATFGGASFLLALCLIVEALHCALISASPTGISLWKYRPNSTLVWDFSSDTTARARAAERDDCRVLRTIRVAVVQYLPFHDVMFPFIAQAFNRCGSQVDFYFGGDLSPVSFLHGLFPTAVLRPAHTFESNAYNAVIASTAKDHFPAGFLSRNGPMMLFFQHLPRERNFHYPSLHLTPLHNQSPVAVPMWCESDNAATRDNSLCIVGRVALETHDMGAVARFRERFPQTQIRVFGRDHAIKPAYFQFNDNLPSKRLGLELRRCAAIGIFPPPSSYHLRDRLTGSLLLAVATRTRIVSSSRVFCSTYKLDCVDLTTLLACRDPTLTECIRPAETPRQMAEALCAQEQRILIKEVVRLAKSATKSTAP